MLEGRVAARLSLRIHRVRPAPPIVLLRLGIEAREETVAEIVIVADDPGGVGVLTDVLFLNAIMLEGIVDHAADESDIGARALHSIQVDDRAGACESRIYEQDICD